jgi:hypothetical protein
MMDIQPPIGGGQRLKRRRWTPPEKSGLMSCWFIK